MKKCSQKVYGCWLSPGWLAGWLAGWLSPGWLAAGWLAGWLLAG
jgi:hypothetical protein